MRPPQIRRSGTEPGSALDRLPQLWRLSPSYSLDACAILLILAVCTGTAIVGAVHTRIFGHDIFLFLDSGWRVLNGQRPAVDFSPGIGELLPLVMAAGLRLAHNSVRGIGYASALLGSLVGLWSYAIGRNRMAWTPAFLISLLLTLIAVAPFPLGWFPNTFSHAMIYNRYGYALLGIVLLESFQKTPRDAGAQRLLGSLSSGILSAALLFLKPSYGLVALVFAAYSVLLDRRNWRRPIGILLGLTAGILAMMAWLRFDFEAVVSSFRLLAAARSGGLSWWDVRWAVVKGLPDFLGLALLVVFGGVIRSSEESIAQSFSPLGVAILVTFGGALLLATNGQPRAFPLDAVLAILLVEQALVAAKHSGLGAAAGFLRADTVILLVGLLCFVPDLLTNASGLLAAIVESRRNPPPSEVARFQSPQLSGLLLYGVPFGTLADDRSNGRVYVTYVNEGMDLIRRVSKPSETVFTLDIFNPFPYALLRRPALGGTDCISFNHQFNDEHKPTADRLFGSADIVMVPKHPSGADVDSGGLLRNYLPTVQARFRLCAETDWWQLYKPPSQFKGCPAERGADSQSAAPGTLAGALGNRNRWSRRVATRQAGVPAPP
jgi:hypothetical protein